VRPSTHTVQQLFEQAVRYEVPLYQRPYVWDRDRQWAPLWDDVATLLDHEPTGTYVQSHFLGALVLEQQRTSPGQIPRYVVIDGQQRLTTLRVLLAATASALAKAGAMDDSALLRDLVFNNPRRASGDERFKVWPTNANRAAFRSVIDTVGDAIPASSAGDRIAEAFAYFNARILNYLTATDALDGAEVDDGPGDQDEGADAGDRGVARRAERLRVTLTDLLKVVSISLDEDDNAQVIFETLNARGTPLLALDLVKNALFYMLTQQSGQLVADNLYETVWRPEQEQDYWRQDRRQGCLFRPTGELFLMHWLTMRLGRTIPATELFATFRQSVLGQGPNAEQLVQELCADAAVMRSFDSIQSARMTPSSSNASLPWTPAPSCRLYSYCSAPTRSRLLDDGAPYRSSKAGSPGER
jgi:hypothetical protein